MACSMWRYPLADMEIQHGAALIVRESQMAMFVNEGKIADLFGPGTHKLTTQTLPLLTNLKNWDKLFASPFKSDVYFFSTRQQLDLRWGTSQPITLRDQDFGAVRLRAFGNYSCRMADPRKFHTEVAGTRERYTVEDLDGQLRGVLIQHLSDAVAQSGVPFLDLAANQIEFAKALQAATAPAFEGLGLQLDSVTVQNVSLPEDLQKILDQKIGMGMVGNDLGKFMQYQTAQAIPKFAEARRAVAAAAALPATPWAWAPAWRWARCWRRTWRPACRATRRCGGRWRSACGRRQARRHHATLEKLGDLKAKAS
jgi:membrane protease subunit (stomatin/prohibitin family)